MHDRGWFADVLLGMRPRDALARAVALADEGMSPRAIYLDVLAPALVEVGARWQRGAASVAQEHLATAVVASIMATLAPRLEGGAPMPRTVIVGSTDGELHSVGARMIGDFLEADGWDVRYLGAATPGVEIDRMAREVLPDAVCLSTTLTTHLPNVATVIAALRASPKPPFTLVGGRAYGGDPAVARHVGADAFAADASEAAVVLRQAFSLD
jgi:methanogenic corrinoid protein MtbC1